MTEIELLREAALVMRADVDGLTSLIDRLTDAWEVDANVAAFDLRRLREMLPAVADWLDAEAAHHDARDQVIDAATGSGEWYVRLSASTLPQAVAVARAFLGRPS